ncbi:ATP-binding protein [Streptomyces sp. CBMA370]|uniref:ATP-binding protein n=1 Tax=Streptomyces sp. CBMA370 TaxID=1930278 RepID=UPI001662112A|nr:ATP-binding protein [Streptomyces sp. CBMA370]
MADQQEASVTLPSEPASVAAARRFVAEVLRGWGLDDTAETADAIRIVVSELATNAVLHTLGRSPEFTVDVRLDRGERLHIGVTDSDARLPRRLPASVQEDSGRGLVIIRVLAAEAGGYLSVVPVASGGKTVRVTLPWAPVRAGRVGAGRGSVRGAAAPPHPPLTNRPSVPPDQRTRP